MTEQKSYGQLLFESSAVLVPTNGWDGLLPLAQSTYERRAQALIDVYKERVARHVELRDAGTLQCQVDQLIRDVSRCGDLKERVDMLAQDLNRLSVDLRNEIRECRLYAEQSMKIHDVHLERLDKESVLLREAINVLAERAIGPDSVRSSDIGSLHQLWGAFHEHNAISANQTMALREEVARLQHRLDQPTGADAIVREARKAGVIKGPPFDDVPVAGVAGKIPQYDWESLRGRQYPRRDWEKIFDVEVISGSEFADIVPDEPLGVIEFLQRASSATVSGVSRLNQACLYFKSDDAPQYQKRHLKRSDGKPMGCPISEADIQAAIDRGVQALDWKPEAPDDSNEPFTREWSEELGYKWNGDNLSVNDDCRIIRCQGGYGIFHMSGVSGWRFTWWLNNRGQFRSICSFFGVKEPHANPA